MTTFVKLTCWYSWETAGENNRYNNPVIEVAYDNPIHETYEAYVYDNDGWSCFFPKNWVFTHY